MRRVLVAIRGPGISKFIYTNERGRFSVALLPGKYLVGLAREYYADKFCRVGRPACLGYRLELRSRSNVATITISKNSHSFMLRYREEFGV